MDTTELTSPGFWQSDACHVMFNDRDAAAAGQAEVIQTWCDGNELMRGHLLFATSGSTGAGKWVALSRRAILASGQAVNEHLQVTKNDHWLLALPTFHVGGIGVVARAYVASCAFSSYCSPWSASGFHQALGNNVTLTSLVPTQLTDLVSEGLRAPDSLRAVLIGGGALSDDVYQKSVALGWPVVETYGMTEAASQIATAEFPDRKMKVLPCWQNRTDAEGKLSIKGAPLLTSCLSVVDGQVTFEPPLDDGWFATSDRVVIEDDCLVFQGRSDRSIKILGELVNLAEVEKQFQSLLGEVKVAVVALTDQRKGSRLVACFEVEGDTSAQQKALDEYNLTCNPVARVDAMHFLDVFPRGALGKIRYQELTKQVRRK